MNEELLYNKLYEKTKDFGRTHFIKEIMRLEQEIQQLKEQLKTKSDGFDSAIKDLCETTEQLQQRDEDIRFCLVSIKQEMEMSTDSRTRKEMRTCYEILTKYKGDNK